MNTLLNDSRYAVRSLVKAPLFTLTVVFVLALGIGATTTIFSIVEGVLLQPLRFREADRISTVWQRSKSGEKVVMSPGNFLQYSERNEVFEQLAAYYTGTLTLLDGGEFPERVECAVVWPGFFSALGVEAALGRTFGNEEITQENAQVMILSHELWNQRFHSDRDIVGRTLSVEGETATVIGVMPPRFDFPDKVKFWIPLTLEGDQRNNYGSKYLRVIGRLLPGVTRAQAQTNLEAIATHLAQDQPRANEGWSVLLVPLHEQVVGDVRPALLLLQGAVILVLLIACANVANLQLVRATSRSREMAVRIAFGAGQGRLMRQLLAESMFLALLGGAGGMLLAWIGLRLVVASNAAELPRLEELGLDPTILAFTLLLVLVIGATLGMTVAFRAFRLGGCESLSQGGRRVTGGGKRLREAFVVAEVALALVLLVGAGLLVNSFVRLAITDPGIDVKNVLTMRFYLADATYPDRASKQRFFDQIRDRVRQMPGVRSVGLANSLPVSGAFGGGWYNAFTLGGGPSPESADDLTFGYLNCVSPDYFETLGIPLLKGRGFQETDVHDRPLVVLIDEAFERKFYPNQDPLGKIISIPLGNVFLPPETPWEIVGVVGSTRHSYLDEPPKPHYYISYRQAPFLPAMSLAVRTEFEPSRLLGTVLEEVRVLDRGLAAYRIKTLEQQLSETLVQRRFNVLLLVLFATAALILATVGVYGLIAYSVNQGIQEIGIRMALGAQRDSVVRLIVKRGMSLAAIGGGIGFIVALGLSRFFSSFLFEVSATDPWTFLAVLAVLMVAVALASYIPARRATRIDPNVALRYE